MERLTTLPLRSGIRCRTQQSAVAYLQVFRALRRTRTGDPTGSSTTPTSSPSRARANASANGATRPRRRPDHTDLRTIRYRIAAQFSVPVDTGSAGHDGEQLAALADDGGRSSPLRTSETVEFRHRSENPC